MHSVNLRHVPEDVYLGLQDMARANHRTLQEQVAHVLEQDDRLRQRSTVQGTGWRHERVPGQGLSDRRKGARNDRRR